MSRETPDDKTPKAANPNKEDPVKKGMPIEPSVFGQLSIISAPTKSQMIVGNGESTPGKSLYFGGLSARQAMVDTFTGVQVKKVVDGHPNEPVTLDVKLGLKTASVNVTSDAKTLNVGRLQYPATGSATSDIVSTNYVSPLQNPNASGSNNTLTLSSADFVGVAVQAGMNWRLVGKNAPEIGAHVTYGVGTLATQVRSDGMKNFFDQSGIKNPLKYPLTDQHNGATVQGVEVTVSDGKYRPGLNVGTQLIESTGPNGYANIGTDHVNVTKKFPLGKGANLDVAAGITRMTTIISHNPSSGDMNHSENPSNGLAANFNMVVKIPLNGVKAK